MWRGWRAGTLTVICALFGMIGCGGETISGVRLAPPGESPELTAVDAAALTALSKQWGLMASGIRTAIERQEVRYRAAPSDRYLNQMSVVQAMLSDPVSFVRARWQRVITGTVWHCRVCCSTRDTVW